MTDHERTARFYKLIWPHRASLLRTAQFLMSNDAAGEDLAQETLIKAFKGLDKLLDPAGAKAWLMTILRNTRIDQARAATHPEVSLNQLDVDFAAPEDAMSRDDFDASGDLDALLNSFSDEQMIKSLRALPQDLRWTLLLVDVEGFDQNEAAVILEIPVGTVKSRLHRGRAMLHASLLPQVRGLRLKN